MAVDVRVLSIVSVAVLCAATMYYQHFNLIVTDFAATLLEYAGWNHMFGADPFIDGIKFYAQEYPMTSALLGGVLFSLSFTTGLTVAMLNKHLAKYTKLVPHPVFISVASFVFFLWACFFWNSIVPRIAAAGADQLPQGFVHESFSTLRFAAGTSGIHTVGFFAAHILHVFLERQAKQALSAHRESKQDAADKKDDRVREEQPPRKLISMLMSDPLTVSLCALIFIGTSRPPRRGPASPFPRTAPSHSA